MKRGTPSIECTAPTTEHYCDLQPLPAPGCEIAAHVLSFFDGGNAVQVFLCEAHYRLLFQLLAVNQGKLHKVQSCNTCPFKGHSLTSMLGGLFGKENHAGVCTHPSRIRMSEAGNLLPVLVADTRSMPVDCPLRLQSLTLVADVPQG